MDLDTHFPISGKIGGLRTCDRCKINTTDAFWCLPCAHEYLHETYSPSDPQRRTHAKKSKLNDFPDVCPTHGLTLFSTQTGLCRPCHSPAWRRTGPNVVRAQARHAGQTTYLDTCETHGETPFGVNTGRCLMCFTAMGAPRKTATPDLLANMRQALLGCGFTNADIDRALGVRHVA